MSSTRSATLSLTSPTRVIFSTSLERFLSLCIKAKSTLRRSAIAVTLQYTIRSMQWWPAPTPHHHPPFRPSRVRRHDYCLLPGGDGFADELENGRLRVQVVDGDVEEAL